MGPLAGHSIRGDCVRERGGRFRVPKRTDATLPLETGLTSGSESLLESSELEAGLTGFGMVDGGGSDKCWE